MKPETAINAANRPSDQEIVSQFNAMRTEMTNIAQKIGELELEKEEHQLVVDTMTPLDSSRKCFRLISGVLVERTVGDVLPTLKVNVENIDRLMKQLAMNYKKKEDELVAFQVRHFGNSFIAKGTRTDLLYSQKKWNIKVKQ
ncbi:hypothetical protein HDV05_001743 [Chytridiales sp. JEL 0842]|nr:hypothetical protein HDV05_001743 [Chytridiales sp. JEL 0842]